MSIKTWTALRSVQRDEATKAENHSDQGSSQEATKEAQNLGISIISIRHGLEIQKSMRKGERANQNFGVKLAIVRDQGIRGGTSQNLCPLGIQLYLSKRYIETLIPSTCEGDLIWKQGICTWNQVKMRSLWWTFIHSDCCPYLKRRRETDRQTDKNRMWWRNRHCEASTS